MSDALNNTSHLYALIVAEPSGDTLGAGLMKAILRKDPQAKFIGIGGPKMCSLGMVSAYNMETLAVMGLTEVLKHLIPILKIRFLITRYLIKARPCVMIGIDAPDFNLYVERKLKEHGIPTVHYVSPSVWAWRQGRIKKIKQSCDEVLALLPFEKEFYDRVHMPCTYVGHTLANQIPLEVMQEDARERLNLYENSVEPVGSKVMAIMPGSRTSVISTMLPIYIKACRTLKQKIPDLCFISAVANHDKALLLKDLWLEYAPDLSITIFVDIAQDVIAASDAVLLTSGTISFEAMLLKKPMCVCYKVSALSAAIAKRMLKVKMFSLPNLLANRKVVPELIQDDCTAENICIQMEKLLTSDNLLMKKEFLSLHQRIRLNSDQIAADAVFKLIESKQTQKTEPTIAIQAQNNNTNNENEHNVLDK